MYEILINIGSLLGAFLVGSIPWGFLVGKLWGIDPRAIGSGNIGATNVARALGPFGFVAVFFLDTTSGFLPVILLAPYAFWFLDGSGVILGVLAILGHIFTPWLEWKGGKGVATASGVAIALTPYAFLISLGAFFVILLLTRFVSVGSLAAAIVFPLATLILYEFAGWQQSNYWVLGFALLITLVVFFTHRKNLKRLWEGSEMPIGASKEQKGNLQI